MNYKQEQKFPCKSNLHLYRFNAEHPTLLAMSSHNGKHFGAVATFLRMMCVLGKIASLKFPACGCDPNCFYARVLLQLYVTQCLCLSFRNHIRDPHLTRFNDVQHWKHLNLWIKEMLKQNISLSVKTSIFTNNRSVKTTALLQEKLDWKQTGQIYCSLRNKSDNTGLRCACQFRRAMWTEWGKIHTGCRLHEVVRIREARSCNSS